MPFHPEPPKPDGETPVPATPSAAGHGDPLGLTRVTFSKAPHHFEFRCDPGGEALLARAVLELARQPDSPLEPGDAFALCRQIESLAQASSSGLPAGSPAVRRKAA